MFSFFFFFRERERERKKRMTIELFDIDQWWRTLHQVWWRNKRDRRCRLEILPLSLTHKRLESKEAMSNHHFITFAYLISMGDDRCHAVLDKGCSYFMLLFINLFEITFLLLVDAHAQSFIHSLNIWKLNSHHSPYKSYFIVINANERWDTNWNRIRAEGKVVAIVFKSVHFHSHSNCCRLSQNSDVWLEKKKKKKKLGQLWLVYVFRSIGQCASGLMRIIRSIRFE